MGKEHQKNYRFSIRLPEKVRCCSTVTPNLIGTSKDTLEICRMLRSWENYFTSKGKITPSITYRLPRAVSYRRSPKEVSTAFTIEIRPVCLTDNNFLPRSSTVMFSFEKIDQDAADGAFAGPRNSCERNTRPRIIAGA